MIQLAFRIAEIYSRLFKAIGYSDSTIALNKFGLPGLMITIGIPIIIASVFYFIYYGSASKKNHNIPTMSKKWRFGLIIMNFLVLFSCVWLLQMKPSRELILMFVIVNLILSNILFIMLSWGFAKFSSHGKYIPTFLNLK